MREIKFRVWDKIENQMLIPCVQNYWLLLSIDGTPYQYTLGKLFEAKTNYDLMQYTGLKDRDGVKIYEGDIIKGKNLENYEEIAQVKWDYVQWYPLAGHRGFEECKVIGNIYQNKDLLNRYDYINS